MKWYPWLNATYRKILASYQLGRGHHALLVYSQSGTGEISLYYALSRWLMCQKPEGIKSCGICHSCYLMKAGNHADFYQPEQPPPHKLILGVDNIRTIIDHIYDRASQGGRKIVLLSHAEHLTEQAGNALLKTLEEPPENTYFLLGCQTPAHLLPTLRSRCLYWPLLTPDEELSLRWLRHGGHSNSLSNRAALRLCGGAPISAETLLQPTRWQERLSLCAMLQDIIAGGDLLTLLPALNRDKDNGPLHWLLYLLTDALKWQHSCSQKFLVNIDKTQLVAAIAARWPNAVLHAQWQHWLHYLRQCQEISSLNRELLLTHYLLTWEQGISNATFLI
ncbi:MAG: DNA polymerase III subunit delta' C-terminal domain-containing protein [Sodalis sp. (in: enterobacteria)]